MKPTYAIPDVDHNAVSMHAGLFGLDGKLIRILHARGYDTPEKIDKFLYSPLSDLYSPFLISGMFPAVSRIRRAVTSGERIGIFADSDLDGITGLAVFYELFGRMKIVPFVRYLKNDETYGMTREIVDEFRDQGVSLLITVDSGIRDTAEIAYARSRGIDVIVSDHHEQDAELPDAIIINPKMESGNYPFKHLAGVGIAFKICHALLLSYLPSYNRLFLIITKADGRYYMSSIRNCIVEQIRTAAGMEQIMELLDSETGDPITLLHEAGDRGDDVASRCKGGGVFDFCGFIASILKCGDSSLAAISIRLKINRKYQDSRIGMLNSIFLQTQMLAPDKIYAFMQAAIGLVSIGSIADLVPLIDENRILAKFGIEALNRTKHPGLSLLYPDARINSKTIGWSIAPLLNTPGRLGMTDLTANFFIQSDPEALRPIISEISALNEARKNTLNQIYARITEDIKKGTLDSSGNIVYVKTDEIPDGFAGLLASRIADNVGKPVILVVFPGKNGIVKGSGRAGEGINFFSYVERFSGRFVRIGGHEQAFGFTAKAQEIDDIAASIESSFSDHPAQGKPAAVDCELEIGGINVVFIKQLEILEPYGNGNAEPIFRSTNLCFESFTLFGNNHGKYLIAENNPLSAVGWGMGPIMKDYFKAGRPLDVIYRLEANEYNGTVYPRMILIDIRFSDKIYEP
ncbi:MAG: single-stranded-DNA-specific exonuclease RecJ [Spirochaetes bacterium RBG_16_49_21]|nr:MAG: single-stranded-DNA-specific exonuclease RecJ [Spirochaetes bacterium RBG_16_49_21]